MLLKPKLTFFLVQYLLDISGKSVNHYSFDFPCTELFSQELLEDCLKVAAGRAGRRKAKEVTASNAYKYHNLKALAKESDDLDLIQKGYNTFNRLKKSVPEEYHHKLVFSVDQITKEKWLEYRERMGKAYPEMAIFKFFKNIFSLKKGLINQDEIDNVREEYEQVFGIRSFDLLMLTSTLMPAKDMAFTVDYFWDLDPVQYGFNTCSKVENLADQEREELLIKILLDIANKIYSRIDTPPTQEYVASQIAEVKKPMLIF